RLRKPQTEGSVGFRLLAASTGLFPIGLDDRVVVTEDQVEAVRIVGDAPDAARRDDPAQYLGEILLTDDPRLPHLRLAALGEFLADAVLAAVGGDISLLQARDRLDFDRVLRGAHPHALERMVRFEHEDRADRDKAVCRLR